MYINNKELANICGGAVSATLLNALSRAASTIYELGRAIGSTIKRLISGTTCKL